MYSFRRTVLLVVMIFTFLSAGCVTQNEQVANKSSLPTNTTQPQPTPNTAKNSSADAQQAVPITLPVLDAFFANETFTADLKSKLGLSDEQIERLKNVARDETSKLRETDKGDYNGSTAGAHTLAMEKIEGIIGEEKARELSALVSERWSGSNTQGTKSSYANSNPNAIPGDTRIVINAPAYRMDVFENGQLIKSYKVGIGYPEFPLPTGLREAETIIFNPTWTPPDEPWVEGSKGIEVGKKIEAGSKKNPLGLIKIPIGLPSLIHGGKSPNKLGSFASHGCVGLTDPLIQDFTQVLANISGTELTSEEIKRRARNRSETQTVKLAKTVPVELRYETILVEDGKLHIYRDVYERGTNSVENLRRVLETYGVTLDQLSEAERAKVMDALSEMSRDAKGNPITPESSDATTDKNNGQTENTGHSKKASTAQVTRTIKGQKEIVIEIAALSGKGYPAPTNNTLKKQLSKAMSAPRAILAQDTSLALLNCKEGLCQSAS